MIGDISPQPTEEEAAAIAAALLAVSAVGSDAVSRESMPRWRWSGRWWTKPIALRRDRPW